MADLLPLHAIYDGTTPRAYFRTSDVYGETGGISVKVGIKKVKAADITGEEEVLPVKEALRVGLLNRITIRYEAPGGKRKSAKLLVRNKTFMSKLFGDVPADTLTGVAYTIAGVSKGTIKRVGIARRAHSY
jgi:hypothetical protein